MIEKDMPYFKLVEAFEKGKCPICSLLKRNVENYLQTLIYEGINDRTFRAQFRKNEGFCHFHSHQFSNLNDGLAIVITHKENLVDQMEHLQKKNSKQSQKNNCAICEMIEHDTAGFYEQVSKFYNDEEFQGIYKKSKGICLPHYHGLLKETKKLPDWLRQFQEERFKDMLTKLEKYLVWANFTQKSEELTEEEKLIPKDIIDLLYGLENTKSFKK